MTIEGALNVLYDEVWPQPKVFDGETKHQPTCLRHDVLPGAVSQRHDELWDLRIAE